MENWSKDTNIDKYSLQSRVFDKIHEDILNGVYKENDVLREMTIASGLGVSRTPVREALRQLELEGLVRIIPNNGASIIGISPKDLKDIYEMRARLEGMCARWAIRNKTEEDIARLEEISDLSEFHVQKGRYDKVLELDNEFHHYLERIRKKTLSSQERVVKTIQEHRDIIDAIKSGDEDKAEECTKSHILNSMKNIEEHGLWG